MKLKASMGMKRFAFAFLLGTISALGLGASQALALTSDEAALVQLANTVVTGQGGTNQAYVSRMSIDGPSALVNWTDNNNSAGMIVASKASGSWAIVTSGGGEPSAGDLESNGFDATTATFLVNNLRPLPPTNGYSANLGGSSTHNLYTERCAKDPPPGTYLVQWADDSSSQSFSTPPITPNSSSTAVSTDVNVTSAPSFPVVVSLYDPSGALLQQNTLSAGQTGGVGYFSPIATYGVYTVVVGGTAPASADPGCGLIVSTSSYTDAVWSGALSW